MYAMRQEMSIRRPPRDAAGLISLRMPTSSSEFNDNHGHRAGRTRAPCPGPTWRSRCWPRRDLLPRGRRGNSPWRCLAGADPRADATMPALRLVRGRGGDGLVRLWGRGLAAGLTISAGVAEYPVSGRRAASADQAGGRGALRAKPEGGTGSRGMTAAPTPPRRAARRARSLGHNRPPPQGTG